MEEKESILYDLLYTYNVTVPLRYYTYDIYSEHKYSEYVMELKHDIDWHVNLLVEEPIPNTNQMFLVAGEEAYLGVLSERSG